MPLVHEVIQVILHHGRIGGEIPFGEIIHIQEVIAAQQVVHHVEEFGLVHADIGTAGQGEELRGTPAEINRGVEVLLVHAAFLYDVFRASLPFLVILAVHIDHAVPVHMDDLRNLVIPRIAGPGRFRRIQPLVVGVLHVEVTRQVLVVIRAGVGRIVPIQGRVAIPAEAVQQGCTPLELVGRREVVLQDGNRFMGDGHARIAHLAVLVAPVGVVHVVSHQVIHLLRGSVRLAALTGSRHEDKTQFVRIVEEFLHGTIIGERAVVHAPDPVVSTHSDRCVEGIGPAVVQASRCVGEHQAEAV